VTTCDAVNVMRMYGCNWKLIASLISEGDAKLFLVIIKIDDIFIKISEK
jgi:hypothetical protein